MPEKPNELLGPKGFLDVGEPSQPLRPWWLELYERMAKQEERSQMHEVGMRDLTANMNARFDKIEAAEVATVKKLDEILNGINFGKWAVGAIWAVIGVCMVAFGSQIWMMVASWLGH